MRCWALRGRLVSRLPSRLVLLEASGGLGEVVLCVFFLRRVLLDVAKAGPRLIVVLCEWMMWNIGRLSALDS